MSYTVISRDEVPAGSFRYMQPAADPSFAVRPDGWAVCTHCAKPLNDADNGASGFRAVLVANFIFSDEQNARHCAENLGVPATLVRPS